MHNLCRVRSAPCGASRRGSGRATANRRSTAHHRRSKRSPHATGCKLWATLPSTRHERLHPLPSATRWPCHGAACPPSDLPLVAHNHNAARSPSSDDRPRGSISAFMDCKGLARLVWGVDADFNPGSSGSPRLRTAHSTQSCDAPRVQHEAVTASALRCAVRIGGRANSRVHLATEVR